jgi:predicted PurR-regulated permease PerM
VIVPAGLAFNNFVVAVVVIAALYFTRDILVPIAISVLLAFLLAPVVRTLQRWHLPKSLAVISAVVGVVIVTVGLATMVMLEVNELANDLPRYQATLGRKIHSLRDAVAERGPLKNVSNLLQRLDEELNDEAREKATGPTNLMREQPAQPIPVEVHQPTPGISETLLAMLRPLATPFLTAAIVVVFLMFFLFQREDLRDRFIRLTGSDDLERTTAALDDASHRLGRLFATQLLLNACFGVAIGLGLAVIGVPRAPLWGLLAMILRFIPYIGAALAAALPVSLAAAVGSDWTMVIWTIALFAIVEPLTGHVAEPLICGRSAGLSPVAIVVAASFWTWLWGPLGLVLSTPLTLCLVVLARHVERLRFIDIMLGDRPALTPQQAAYQRMLTGDPIEAIEQARKFLKENSVAAYYEEILLGALRLAQADAERGRLDDTRLKNIVQTVSELIEDLSEHASADKAKGPSNNIVTLNRGKAVLCLPGLGRLDACAALTIADFLKREGIEASVGSIALEENPSVVCLTYLEDASEARIAYALRRLSRQGKAAVIVCLLGTSEKAADDILKLKQPLARSLRDIVAAMKERSIFTGSTAGVTEGAG